MNPQPQDEANKTPETEFGTTPSQSPVTADESTLQSVEGIENNAAATAPAPSAAPVEPATEPVAVQDPTASVSEPAAQSAPAETQAPVPEPALSAAPTEPAAPATETPATPTNPTPAVAVGPASTAPAQATEVPGPIAKKKSNVLLFVLLAVVVLLGLGTAGFFVFQSM